ncbi:MAG: hypothetical protein ABSB19_04860 [Methylomonas sp.]
MHAMLTAWLSGCLVSCATAPANSGFNNFSGYAESVFRHQNAVSSRLMMSYDADQIDDDDIENAEDDMNNACSLLNEYAERENSGESMGWKFKSKVKDSIQNCDVNVRRLEDLLNKTGKPASKN